MIPIYLPPKTGQRVKVNIEFAIAKEEAWHDAKNAKATRRRFQGQGSA